MHPSPEKTPLNTFTVNAETSRTVLTSIHLTVRHQGHAKFFIIIHIVE